MIARYWRCAGLAVHAGMPEDAQHILALWSLHAVADQRITGPASYFPSIEKTYGRPIAEWQALVRERLPAKHMDLVAMLKSDHGMGHGHANAVVAHTLAEPRDRALAKPEHRD